MLRRAKKRSRFVNKPEENPKVEKVINNLYDGLKPRIEGLISRAAAIPLIRYEATIIRDLNSIQTAELIPISNFEYGLKRMKLLRRNLIQRPFDEDNYIRDQYFMEMLAALAHGFGNSTAEEIQTSSKTEEQKTEEPRTKVVKK